MITDMVFREDYEDEPERQSEIEYLRHEINHIDDELINLLSNRMKIARQIGEYKKKNNMTILQQRRWNDIIEKSKVQAAKSGLSEDFIIKFINAIHSESIDQQEDVFRENNWYERPHTHSEK